MTQKIGAGLLEYAGKIWDTADTLRGAGIKESEWPTYMMPFFALMMLESRLRRFKKERIAEFEKETGTAFNPEDATHAQWLDDSAKAINKGYHKDLLLHDKGLRETCLVPGGNFLNRLLSHLNQYDPDTKKLLGIDYAQGSAKFLDMQGKASDLNARDNNPLYPFAQKWASIDLTPFDNSEITTIEEHIKRKWADISAETAGEQYTPSDVIDLATALIIELRREGKGGTGIADVYDMACGGGNFLFATEDALRDAFPELSVRTRGQELNDALYALASIEARFREDAKIEWGNTLTNDLFISDKFDAIVANPPYGVDWKDFKQNLSMDASGRFAKDRMPPTSDGQLLFLQHAAFHLSEVGVAAIVHSGSTLFSGDAGGGESETRRWLIQQQDIVEAIVQLPKNEFFNTGISTYLWILNRAKPKGRKGKVLLINAENNFVKLQRNLNKKNCKIDEANCATIVEAFRAYADGPISKVLTIDQLLYNKVEIILHRHDEEGRAIQEETALDGDVITVTSGGQNLIIKNGPLLKPDHLTSKEAAAAFNEAIKAAEALSVQSGKLTYTRDNETGAIRLDDGASVTELGLGVLTVKAKVAKAKGAEVLKVDVTLGPLKEKDTETTAFSSELAKNTAIISDFLATWVKEPFERVPDGVTVGCEINFNRIFFKESGTRSTYKILKDLSAVEEEITSLEAEIASVFGAKDASNERELKDSGIPWIGEMPANWGVARGKNLFRIKKKLVGDRAKEFTLLSLTKQGIIARDMENPQGKFPAEFDTYQAVAPGDFVFCLFDVEETPRTVELSSLHGMITGAYTVMKNLLDYGSRYLYYQFLSFDDDKRLRPLYTGMRNTIPKEVFMGIRLAQPPQEEQDVIATWLDTQTEHIDRHLALLAKKGDLLRELRKALIHEAVTGKITPPLTRSSYSSQPA